MRRSSLERTAQGERTAMYSACLLSHVRVRLVRARVRVRVRVRVSHALGVPADAR